MTKKIVDGPKKAICPLCYKPAKVISRKGKMVYLKCCGKLIWCIEKKVEE